MTFPPRFRQFSATCVRCEMLHHFTFMQKYYNTCYCERVDSSCFFSSFLFCPPEQKKIHYSNQPASPGKEVQLSGFLYPHLTSRGSSVAHMDSFPESSCCVCGRESDTQSLTDTLWLSGDTSGSLRPSSFQLGMSEGSWGVTAP